MEPQPDFRELLRLFEEHDVEYLVVGAYALAFHGVPRATGDLDILIRADVSNAQAVLSALDAMGFSGLGLSREDFIQPNQVIQLGLPPVRVDILTSLSGVSWEEAIAGRQKGKYGDLAVLFLGRNELLKNKRAVGRKQDLADLEALGEEYDPTHDDDPNSEERSKKA